MTQGTSSSTVRSDDETAVLRRLLPGEMLGCEFEQPAFTCGGCAASAKEWRALGVLVDLVLANQTGRMHPRQFQRRVLWTHYDPGAQRILVLAQAIAIAQSNAEKRYREGLAACKRRDSLGRYLFGDEAGIRQKGHIEVLANASILPDAAGPGIERVLGMLDGIVRATRKQGVGGRVWQVRELLCRSTLEITRYRDDIWTALAPVCGHITRLCEETGKMALGAPGYGFARAIGTNLYSCIRDAGEESIGSGIIWPDAREWCVVLCATVVCASFDEHRNAAAGSAMQVMARAGERVVRDIPEVDGVQAIQASCKRLAALNSTGNQWDLATLDSALADLDALFEQARQYTRIQQAAPAGAKRRMA